MTGGNPRSTGVYYDVEYSHKVDEAGAACTPGQPATGGDVIYDSPDDALASVPDFIDPANGTFPSFDENGSIYPHGADTNPAAIMNLKFDPKHVAQPGHVPRRPEDLQADHPVGLPRRQHDLPSNPQGGPAHRLVGQARGLRVIQWSGLERPEHRRPLLTGDRLAGGHAERCPVPAGRRLGAHRRRHQAVRRL